MDKTIYAIYGILIPFLGTGLGAACVFFMKGELKENIQKVLIGFAAGVMVAASIWSLLIPAIEQEAEHGNRAVIPAVLGFWVGILFLLLMDHLIPHLHRFSEEVEGPRSTLKKTTMMMLYVVVEELIPEMSEGKHSDSGTLSFALGFSVMMCLDVLLG